MLEYLKEIKEELFDAPKDTKESFNNIVKYLKKEADDKLIK